MFKVTVRNLFANKVRLLLTGFSIIIGVAFVSGTFILSDTINKSFGDLYSEINSGVDIVVSDQSPTNPDSFSNNVKPLPESYLQTVQNTPGVQVATGDVLGTATLIGKDGEDIQNSLGAPNLAAAWTTDPDLAAFEIKTGRAPKASNEVVVDVSAAKNGELSVGGPVTIYFAESHETFKLVGTATFGPEDDAAGATMALFETTTAQNLLGYPNQFTSIAVKVKDGADVGTVIRAINKQLPSPFKAITGQDETEKQTDKIEEQIGFVTTFLLVFSLVAVFVSGYIISNTFSILIAQRTRGLALLRALGASRKQVLSSIMIESVVVGALASIVGIFAGFLVAIGLQALFGAVGASFPDTPLQFQTRTAVVGFLIGFFATVLSAILPARRASRIAPVTAMRENIVESRVKKSRRIPVAIGLGLLAIAFMLVGLFADTERPLPLIGIGALFAFFAVTVVTPIVVRPVTTALRTMLRWIATIFTFGAYRKSALAKRQAFVSSLAKENTQRNPRRTSITASALMIGIALVTSVTILVSSLKQTVDKILNDNLTADFIMNNNQFATFSHELATSVGNLSSIEASYGIQFDQWRDEKNNFSDIMAVDSGAFKDVFRLNLPQSEIDGFNEGGLLVDQENLKNDNLKVGDTMDMIFVKGPATLTIVGSYDKKKLPLQSPYMISRETFAANYTEKSDRIVFANAKPGQLATAEKQVAKVAKNFPTVDVTNQKEFIAEQQKQLDGILVIFYGLLFLAIIIAILGIINTLALTVIERTRELGLLRGVGTKRMQLWQMIRNESVNIACVGAALGVMLGIVFGVLIVKALHDEGVTELTIPFGLIISLMLFSGFAGIMASVFPSIRAARLDILKAIQAD